MQPEAKRIADEKTAAGVIQRGGWIEETGVTERNATLSTFPSLFGGLARSGRNVGEGRTRA